MVQRRWKSSFKSAKTYPGADCGSDHQLLSAEMKVKLRKIKRPKKPTRFDVTKINDQYSLQVKNRFQTLFEEEEDESTPEEMWQGIKDAVIETAETTIPKCKSKKSHG